MTKIAVVTGATGGMGTEIVAELAKDYEVYALGRDTHKLAALAGGRVHPVALELTDILDRPEDSCGLPELDRVDVMVHAAAIAQPLNVEDATPAQWRAHMDTNVHAPAELTRRYLPALRTGGGTCIFINSGAGRASFGGNTVYAATKHALYALADGLRKAEQSFRVSTIAPGQTDTPMLAGLQEYDPEHVIAPVEIARAVRAVVDAGPTTQLTEVQVRPRIELADRV